ncbi:MAG: histidine phosphatase family protein, partial [Methylococcaceae bacterium]
MKRLVLIRHAKSSWKNADLDDFDRPLSGRGKREAPATALRLKQLGLQPDLLLSSPAKRARKTAKIVAETLAYPVVEIRLDARLYLQGVDALEAVLAETGDADATVMLVGHNPDLTRLAERLTGETLDEIPTAGVVDIR